jgi:SET domain-containing protein
MRPGRRNIDRLVRKRGRQSSFVERWRDGKLGQQQKKKPYYRAPEVILGCGWDSKADIWNFGVLVRPL